MNIETKNLLKILSTHAEYEVNAKRISVEPINPPAKSLQKGTLRLRIIDVQYRRRLSKSQFNSQMIST